MTERPKIRLAVLASGGGSNLQAILDACRPPIGEASAPLYNLAEVAVVVSDKPGAYALERAKKAGVEALLLDPKGFPDRAAFYQKAVVELQSRKIDLILLAGYMLKLEPNIIKSFQGRILNIHPALLPKFGGKGMYGHFVHEAVLKAGEKESGATVHVVDEEFDHGPVLLQNKIPVLPGDTAESLAERVLEQEHKLYPEAVAAYLRKIFG
ncbi:MAG: phosphoribosylglycinamide formyltransferase [Elusimicrobia bacterium RIFCSPLOWO2_01_FULL_60_11]|nr:MAG: phosphoribosylglycinamide formyltransferase [Elusimicrobia bacterium RIFCSPLOWO2_01_FULL_60_11]